MQRIRLDLNLLVALDALLREKHVTRAAERVCLSQPAMSGSLGKLREFFNDPLLIRVGRGLELTPRGLALLEPVREALLGIQSTLGTQAAFDPATVRRTFVAMVPDFTAPWLAPRMLKRVTAQAPGVRMQFQNWSKAGAARLANGEIDFFVALDRPRILGLARFADALRSEELQRIRWVCAVAVDHPTVHDELTREQFLSLPHVYVRTPGDTRSGEEAVQSELGLKLDVRVSTETVLEVPFMLAGTSLIAILPEALATLLCSCLTLRIFALPAGLALRSRLKLLWHKRSELDPGHAWMRALMLEAARGSSFSRMGSSSYKYQ